MVGTPQTGESRDSEIVGLLIAVFAGIIGLYVVGRLVGVVIDQVKDVRKIVKKGKR